MMAFLKKDFLEQARTGKLLILLILFVLFGIMNPAVAKLTPWLLEMMADSLEASGMVVTEVTVTAMDSWVQFFKNIPMALIAFVLLEGGILTGEYQSGTLVLSLTKGLKRHQVLGSKAMVLTLLWTVCYWLCFAITYGYNAYFWDNSVAEHLLFSAVCWWLFGLWVIALMLLFSVVSASNTGVFLGTGAIVLGSVLLGMIPKAKKYLPTVLCDGNSLIYGAAEAADYQNALLVLVATGLTCLVVAVPVFNKKQL